MNDENREAIRRVRRHGYSIEDQGDDGWWWEGHHMQGMPFETLQDALDDLEMVVLSEATQ